MKQKREDVLALDKDDTIYESFEPRDTIYPGASEFIDIQRQTRKVVIATTAGKMATIDQVGKKLGFANCDIFGRQELNGEDVWIAGKDGIIKKSHYLWSCDPKYLVDVSGQSSILIADLEKQGLKVISNPNFDYETHSAKDLLLLRRHIARRAYAALNMVMIGNMDDKDSAQSDPNTPLVVVYPGGEWLQDKGVKLLIKQLFGEKGAAQEFDTLFDQGIPKQRREHQKEVGISGRKFIFDNQQGRIIYT